MALNDSGYCSPLTRSGKVCEEKAHFVVENPWNHNHDTVITEKEDVLVKPLEELYPNIKTKNMLVWAEIESYAGVKCINPFLMPCGFIKSGTLVKMKQINEIVYDFEMQSQDTKPYSKLQGSVFCISISGREKLPKITKIHYTKLRSLDVCVFADRLQTFEEALIADRRFMKVNQFILKRTQLDGGATVGMDKKPSDISQNLILEVKVKKSAPAAKGKSVQLSTPKSAQSMLSTGESTSNLQDSSSMTPKKKLNKLTGELWKLNSIYAFSKHVDDLEHDEMFSEMEECLKARAWFTLIGPEGRGKKLENVLAKIVQIQFSNNHVLSRPVRFTKELCKLYNAVGFLKCGSVIATCFLLSKDVIATNWHVVNDIRKARRASLPDDHIEVYVHFDYEGSARPDQESDHKLKDLNYVWNQICEELDYALLFLENPVEELQPLGEYVRSTVPEEGKVCIVGHPGGNEKQDELCAILPLHNDRRALELERRFEKSEMHCTNNPSHCTLSFARQNCVHSYRPQLQHLCQQEEKMTYDVGSMGKGASGAPVFDMKCNIVALHTGGFALHDGNKSVVEYGITFKAIVQHLRENVYLKFVKDLFPNCLVEDMETD